jgi:hypothetical protein
MMIRFGLGIAAAFAATLAGGCATPNDTQKVADEDKVYVTGSRIPKDKQFAGAVEETVRPPTAGTAGRN